MYKKTDINKLDLFWSLNFGLVTSVYTSINWMLFIAIVFEPSTEKKYAYE